MKQVLGIVLALSVFALLQMSFFVHFFPPGLIPNFVMLSVLLLSIFEKRESLASFVAAVFGGFLMDVFSGGIIGLWPSLLLLGSLLIKEGLENYVRFPIPKKF